MRMPLIKTSHFSYFVTFHSNHPEWFYISSEHCWNIFADTLSRTIELYSPEIHLMVQLSDRVEMILSTPLSNLDSVMSHFLAVSTKAIQRRSDRINHIFGSRYRWSILESSHSLAYAYKYVARNPVREGICQKVEYYPFSTLNILGTKVAVSERIDDYWRSIPRNEEARLTWLNRAQESESEKLVGRALRRYRFRFTTESNLQRDLRELRTNYGVEN